MKRFFTILPLLYVGIITTNIAKGQSYLSQTYISAMNISYKIHYTGGSYKPDYLSFYIINSRQAKYNEGRAVVQNELYNLYNVLDELLINQHNRTQYKEFVATVKKEVPKWNNYDLSYSSNVESLVNFITQIYSWESIKAEITLIKECSNELNRIKRNDPDNYIYSKRYKAIVKTLDKLKYCEWYEIKNLSWQQTELSM